MHCELVVPRLFAERVAARLPGVEMLLARARCTSQESCSFEGWLQEAFGLGETRLPAGASTELGAGRDPGTGCWVRADPVHLRVMRERLIVVPGAALNLTPDDAQSLCEAINAHFGERLALRMVEPERWAARLAEEMAVDAPSPLEIAGRDVDLGRPAGADAARSHKLMNEAQMVLHSHPVNEAREKQGLAPVNSIWLWGAGRPPKLEGVPWQSVTARDPLVLGLARAAGVRHRPLPASAAAWLERAPEEGRHLIALDMLRAPHALGLTGEYHDAMAGLERDWFAPLLQALREGRIGMVTIHVPDAGECASYETIRGDLRRFWRRPKALEHYS
ncbi:MAG TPA: hypothetical protein VFK84_10055 [Burkholderiales bacterium]|nr:hypothetical protein [Burkholderiales bacterium]